MARNNRVSHALLFTGDEGSGCLPLALAFSQYITCSDKTENDSCGKCTGCVKSQKIVHPDIHFVYPVATTGKIKKEPVSSNFADEWRRFMIENPYSDISEWFDFIGIEKKQGGIQRNESSEIIKILNFKSYEADFKIMIIWMLEKMNETCANKLLKILEEPPPDTIFLMVAESTEFILPTILSRVQIINVPKIDSKDIFSALKKKFNLDDETTNVVVQNSYGNYNVALKLIESNNSSGDYFNYFSNLMRFTYARNMVKLNELIEELSKLGREKQKLFIEYSLRMFRENFIQNKQLNEISFMYKEEAEFSSKFNKFINEKNIMQITKEFNEAHYHIERNANAKIIFLDLGLKLSRLLLL